MDDLYHTHVARTSTDSLGSLGLNAKPEILVPADTLCKQLKSSGKWVTYDHTFLDATSNLFEVAEVQQVFVNESTLTNIVPVIQIAI